MNLRRNSWRSNTRISGAPALLIKTVCINSWSNYCRKSIPGISFDLFEISPSFYAAKILMKLLWQYKQSFLNRFFFKNISRNLCYHRGGEIGPKKHPDIFLNRLCNWTWNVRLIMWICSGYYIHDGCTNIWNSFHCSMPIN